MKTINSVSALNAQTIDTVEDDFTTPEVLYKAELKPARNLYDTREIRDKFKRVINEINTYRKSEPDALAEVTQENRDYITSLIRAKSDLAHIAARRGVSLNQLDMDLDDLDDEIEDDSDSPGEER